MNNYTNEFPESWLTGDTMYSTSYQQSPPRKPSTTYGHHYFAHLDDDFQNGSRKAMFISGRRKVSDFLKQYDKDVLKKYGIDDDAIKQWDEDTEIFSTTNPQGYNYNSYNSGKNVGFDNDNSRKIYYFLADIGNSTNFRKNSQGKEYYTKDKNGKLTKFQGIPLGENVTKGIATFDTRNDTNYLSDKERNLLYTLADSDLKGAVHKGENGSVWFDNNDYTTWVDNDGNKHVTIGVNHKPIDQKRVQRGGTYSFVISKDGDKLLPIKANEKNTDYDFDYENPNSSTVVRDIQRVASNGRKTYAGRNGNIFRIISSDPQKAFTNWNPQYDACGGKTSRRLYASGGSMEAPMPLGPQEDYNAINAGGSHEMNPQGGVPYGVNQDGSQNMVEEGEVSVGNNIFSDRTAMSPELCQQLGLPEGTSPAQAMQQIEALYEQGQIGDEEFQEIQQIIFEDQEAQKQQGGGEQMPVEGISPEMVQGGGMQPEMMQGSPMPQQVQNEGIQPEMVQGYGFGGYR